MCEKRPDQSLFWVELSLATKPLSIHMYVYTKGPCIPSLTYFISLQEWSHVPWMWSNYCLHGPIVFSSWLDLCFSQSLCLRSLDNRDIIARGQYRHSCHKRFNKYIGNGFYVNHEFMLSDFGTHMKQTVASNTDKMNSKLIYGTWIRGNYVIVFIFLNTYICTLYTTKEYC